MFPSQRGNFFKGQGSTESNYGGTKSMRSMPSFGRTRSKSPPLGASAQTTPVNGSTEQTPNSSLGSGSTEDERSTVVIPPTKLPTVHETLSKISQLSGQRPRPNVTSKHFLASSITPPSRKPDYYNPFLSKFSSSLHTPQIHLSRIPSSWSNRQMSFNDPFNQFNLHERFFNFASDSSNSKPICGGGKDGACTKLPTKTQQERLLVKKLCEEALKNRGDAFAFYSNMYDEEMSQNQVRLDEFDPKNHKGILCEFMLKLVLERQQLLDDRRHSFILPRKNVLGDPEDHKPCYTPVYCVEGKTIVGKSYESVNFPNSFALLTDLQDPREDPSGFRRFCTLVNMKGFEDTEIFLRVRGNCLTVDGVHLTKDVNKKAPSGARVVSIYVELPIGVYPDYLRIGRSSDGILVIQEPWKF